MIKGLSKVFLFYLQGFKGMTVGKRLWGIIFIKLFILFVVFKLFFFPDFLQTRFATDEERGDHVMNQLLKPAVVDP